MPLPNQNPVGQGFSVKPADIVGLFFRHKWKLLGSVVLGVVLGAVLLLVEKPTFISDARLMVRYVIETRTVGPSAGTRQIKDPDAGSKNLLSSELQIITSQDLFEKVATSVGPKRLIADSGITNPAAGSLVVAKGLTVQSPARSDIILLSYGHHDAQVAQDVLRELIKAYLAKHNEVHRSSESFEFLQGQTDSVRLRLTETENELRKVKTEAGIISIDTAKEEVPARISSLRQSISLAQAELAQEIAQFNSGSGRLSDTNLSSTASKTNAAPVSAATSGSIITDNSGLVAQPQDETAARDSAQRLNQQLAELLKQKLELGSSFKESAKPMQQVLSRISEVQAELRALGPLASAAAAPYPGAMIVSTPRLSPPTYDPNRIVGLQARLKILEEQLKSALQEAKRLESFEDDIRRLERRRELEESQYKYFFTSLEQAKIDNQLDATSANNISVIQTPSVARRSKDDHVKALAAFVLPVIMLLAYLAVTEVVFPSKFRQGHEIESALKIPVLVSVPHFGVNGHSKLRLVEPLVDSARSEPGPSNTLTLQAEIPPWDPADPMLEYYEALRDRLVMSYEGDLHKPKIVGLTSCNKGAGVSRIATGLAAALSRDVERRVLYIALERGKVMVSAFEKGRPSELTPPNGGSQLNEASSNEAIVQQNLLCLATQGRGTTGAGIVQTFSDLLPRLKHSDFDYIVFDLPPLSQTGGSLRLAAQMERALVVVEAEVSDRQKLERAKKLLNHDHFYAVLNKAKSFGPKALREELI